MMRSPEFGCGCHILLCVLLTTIPRSGIAQSGNPLDVDTAPVHRRRGNNPYNGVLKPLPLPGPLDDSCGEAVKN